jgi:hypothetical protein
MAPKMRVVYTDGREVIIPQTPRALIATERKWGSMEAAPNLEATFHTAYIAATNAGLLPEGVTGFEDFVNAIVDFGELEDPPKAEAEPSSTSAGSEPASPSSTG